MDFGFSDQTVIVFLITFQAQTKIVKKTREIRPSLKKRQKRVAGDVQSGAGKKKNNGTSKKKKQKRNPMDDASVTRRTSRRRKTSGIPKRFSALSIYNVVFTVHMGPVPFDLSLVANKMHGRFSPRRFPAASFPGIDVYKRRSTLCLFRGGKEVLTGLKDKDAALLAQHSFAMVLERYMNTPLRLSNFKLQNIVASMAIGRCIDMDRLQTLIPHTVVKEYPYITHAYEPDVFPGLQLWWVKDETSKMVVIIFDSGAMVIAGAKNTDELVYMTYLACSFIDQLPVE